MDFPPTSAHHMAHSGSLNGHPKRLDGLHKGPRPFHFAHGQGLREDPLRGLSTAAAGALVQRLKPHVHLVEVLQEGGHGLRLAGGATFSFSTLRFLDVYLYSINIYINYVFNIYDDII